MAAVEVSAWTARVDAAASPLIQKSRAEVERATAAVGLEDGVDAFAKAKAPGALKVLVTDH